MGSENKRFRRDDFVDLRDRYGITQLAFDIKNKLSCLEARSLNREFVIQVKGLVIERENLKNNKIYTGAIEIEVNELLF